jgi:hypothetical protein
VASCVTLALILGAWVWGERGQKQLRAELQQLYQELQTRMEGSRQERRDFVERAEQRGDRVMAAQQRLVELSQQSVQSQELMIQLLRQVVEQRAEPGGAADRANR